jgi:hypothetical protein
MPVENSIDLENDLPAELQVLAKQLGADAAFLAARYPATPEQRRATAYDVALGQGIDVTDDRSYAATFAEAVGVDSRVASAHDNNDPSARGSMSWLVAAGTCAAVTLIALVSWQTNEDDGRRTADRRASATSAGAPLQVAKVDDERSAQTPSGTAATIRRTSDNVLEGLSGAEQEAVLDLLENRTEQEGSLSI